MLENLGSCDVFQDEFYMGRSALMFTSLQYGGAKSLNAFLYKVCIIVLFGNHFDLMWLKLVEYIVDRRQNLFATSRKRDYCT
jgi:hypothetical protein